MLLLISMIIQKLLFIFLDILLLNKKFIRNLVKNSIIVNKTIIDLLDIGKKSKHKFPGLTHWFFRKILCNEGNGLI